ncbi:MAG: ImmA/IrrE family metallo-endopeptidase [Lachnotalea sp.]
MSDIRGIVNNIKSKYKTSSPYDLVSAMDIQICRCELGQIHGYYYRVFRIKQIFLNCNLSKTEEKLVLSHELGHSVLHPNANTPFLRADTYLSVDKMEIEANKFAIELLISDSDLLEYSDYSLDKLSAIFGYHSKLIELRLK